MIEIIGGDQPPGDAPGKKPKIIIDGAAPAEAPEAGKKIVVDEDWKEQARREAQEAEDQAQEQAQAGPELPPADFKNFINGLVEQCLMELGAVVHPMLGQRVVNPPMARYTIEVLGMLQEKTKGNLDDEEAKFLEGVLHSLRLQCMNVTKQLLEAADRGELKTIGAEGEPAIGALPPEKETKPS